MKGRHAVGESHIWGIPLGIISLVLFGVGFLGPSIAIVDIVGRREYSLFSGIVELWVDHKWFLATLLFAFTAVTPPLKTLGTIALMAPRFASHPRRRQWRIVVQNLGKWSLLDVWAIAVVVVAMQIQGFVHVEVGWGIYVFAASILLSIAAGHCVRSEPTPDSLTMSDSNESPGSKRPKDKGTLWLAVAGLALGACGVLLWITSSPGTVESVVVVKNEGFEPIGALQLGQPDYFIELHLDGETRRLETKENTPIGNGLRWELENPAPLESFEEIHIHNKGLLGSKLLDRVAVSQWQETGQEFTFYLEGRLSQPRITAMSAIGLAGVCWVYALARALSRR